MSRNGAGLYSRAVSSYVYNTVIDQAAVNSEMDDIATALTASLAKDGQTTPTANLPMGTYRHTGVGAASATTDYARYDQVQNSASQVLSSVSGADTITANATPTPAAYAVGQTFRFVAVGANTGAVTLNVSSLGAKAITKNGTTALSAGDIPSGMMVVVTYDGTQFQLGTTGGNLTGGNLTGGINSARGNITQHATTMDFFAVTSPDILDGTGSAVTITACVNAPQAGATRKFYPIVATVLTHGATFDIAGNANLTAAAGDCWIIEAKTVSTYRVTAVKEDGTAVVSGGGFATGMGMALHGATVPSGWILADGRTIGSAASGATNRANADCANLYAEFWNSYANTELAVSSGRGADAAADFAANKTIDVPDMRGRVVAGKDNMGGTTASRLTNGGSGITATTLGVSGGTETHTLTTAQLASHSHTFSTAVTIGSGVVYAVQDQAATAGSKTTNTAGSDNAHQNTQPTHIANWIIKL